MKNFTTLFSFLLIGLCTKATIINVTVSNFQFSPANIPNVVIGDVIQFNFGGPNFHNATSVSLGVVPAGAAQINSGGIGSVTTSYSYTVTVAGAYRYYCEAHSADGVTGMVGTFTASGVVPVQLKIFDAVFANGSVTANWQTVTEQNLAYFSIQKSTDGRTYVEAGRVNATGNSGSLLSYNFKDEHVDMTARYVYYLLKTVDRDGRYSLSQVKLVRNSNANPKLITQIGPNPVSKEVGHLMFQFNADRTGDMKAVVIDAAGKIVMRQRLYAVKGINNGHIHMSELAKGMYTIVFSMDGLKETKKVMITD